MKICGSCQKSFACSVNEKCWCFEHPKLIFAYTGDCFCEACLIKKNAEIVNSGVPLTQQQKDSIANLSTPKDLSENIDYFINEEGNFVFSKWYHLRRGYCCGNKCLHCPY